MITLLKDLTEDCVDAVIVSQTTTSKEIEDCIQHAKEIKDMDWQFEDLLEALPSDCEITTRWSGELGCAWY